MNPILRFPLDCNAAQHAQLLALQKLFAQACNEMTLQVAQTRVWNRVALHHLHYRMLRQKYPALGSQMACNAIYAVSRTARLLYQAVGSPFYIHKMGERPLPRLLFSDDSPVYFDLHTLSMKEERLSLFTLDGRMQFGLSLSAAQGAAFAAGKPREIVLARRADGMFALTFYLVLAKAQEGVAGSGDSAGAGDQKALGLDEGFELSDDEPAAGAGAGSSSRVGAGAADEMGTMGAIGGAGYRVPAYVSLEGVA
jgi:hypothetical protein